MTHKSNMPPWTRSYWMKVFLIVLLSILLGILGTACGDPVQTPSPDHTPSIKTSALPPISSSNLTPAFPSPMDHPTPIPTFTPIIMNTPPKPTPQPTLISSPTPSTPTVLSPGALLLITSPPDNSVVTTPILTVSGSTTVDAIVSVNGNWLLSDVEGVFRTELFLQDGPNLIEIIASSMAGASEISIVTVVYSPQEG